MEVMSGAELQKIHKEVLHSSAHAGAHQSMVFTSEDGEKTVIKEFHGDSLTWTVEEDDVHAHHGDVLVIKSDDGKTYEIITDGEGEAGTEKKVKVWISEDDEGQVKVKSSSGEHVHMEKIVTEGAEGENVKVIVIKKKVGDCDHEHDHEEEVEVEVEVKKESKQ
jgi:hypothetical protein